MTSTENDGHRKSGPQTMSLTATGQTMMATKKTVTNHDNDSHGIDIDGHNNDDHRKNDGHRP